MSFIKNMLIKLGTGFLYGAGFSVAIVIVVSLSLSKLSNSIIGSESEMNQSEEIETEEIETENENEYMFKKYDESAKLVTEITKERISKNEFTLLGILKNEGESSWSSINIKAELFDKNGEFIDECSDYISDNSSPGSSINFKLSCGNCSKFQLGDYHSYKLSITSAHHNMQ
ncbi:FxLYD domain-containing protein [Cellvibrio sp.]